MSEHPVKRKYDATARRASAAATRERICAAAEQRFVRDGYARTSIRAVAKAAGVAEATVYLAFPDGRLRSSFERVLVVCAYVSAIALQVLKAMLGGLGPDNLLATWDEPDLAHTVEQVQLLSISAMCLVAIGLLANRRRHAGRPLRRRAIRATMPSWTAQPSAGRSSARAPSGRRSRSGTSVASSPAGPASRASPAGTPRARSGRLGSSS